MDSMLRRLVATWIKSQDAASHRRAPAATVRCETLEDRQLLSTASLFRGNAVMPVSMGGSRGGPAVLRGTMNGQQNPLGIKYANLGGVGASEGGQAGGLRAQGYTLWGGANRGGLGARNGLRAHAYSLNGLGNSAATPAVRIANATPTIAPDAQAVTLEAPSSEPVTVTSQVDPSSAAVTATPVDAVTSYAPGDAGFVTTRAGALGGGVNGQGPVFRTLPAPADGGLAAVQGFAGDQTGPSEEVTAAFDKLQTDMQAIQDKSEVTPKLLAAVRKDFDAIQAATTGDPDKEALKALNTSLETLDGQLPNDEQRAQIMANFTAVLQSQGVTDQTLIDRTIADIEAVATASHVTADDLATIAADHDAIQAAIEADAGGSTVGLDASFDAVGSLVAGLTGGLGGGAPIMGGPVLFHGGLAAGAEAPTLTDAPFQGVSTTIASAHGGLGGRFDVAPAVFSSATGQGGAFRQFVGGRGGDFGGPWGF